MTAIFRVQWRHPNWSSSSWSKSKTFHRRGAALRFASQMVAVGYEVNVSTAQRDPWAPLKGWEVKR